MKSKINIVFTATTILCVLVAGILFFNLSVSGSKTGDCVWELDGRDLRIFGNGEMRSYSGSFSSPWGKKISTATIERGVTSVGQRAFYNANYLTGVIIPNTVTKIEKDAFFGCINLRNVYFLGTKEQWNRIPIDTGNSVLNDVNIEFYVNYQFEKTGEDAPLVYASEP